ncbi:MAG: transcriptional regulator NrdR [candidate division KSB1 bacterium]|nr:transcriptional regulator NrdR [candidate division KSB1 bacterium]MDZ7275352.1 transcriptional regulator NrdR [candidate division KSB1 bacterium]MDZ7287519.1 transcriptional regulator NrdR [candidate division KSB1 bacterium]MDZ7299633.1 transcriptional regulator NrdR [candidate division KSB1 bacterium]MDZ7307426.1 transcriptional regulator NrdR [candidate division KSB1 bacterium]
MRCPYCHHEDSRVIDSRTSNEGRVVRRRRECLSCQKRYTTKEYIEETPLIVVKGDGRREPFNREKILHGIQIACSKRPVSMETINQCVDEIESRLRDGNHEEISSRLIGQLVMEKLRKIDEVAYVRFASVYRKFQAKEEFLEELKGLEIFA